MQEVFLTNPTSILTNKTAKQVENPAKIPFMSLDRMNANQWMYPSQPVVKPHREVYGGQRYQDQQQSYDRRELEEL